MTRRAPHIPYAEISRSLVAARKRRVSLGKGGVAARIRDAALTRPGAVRRADEA